MTKSVIFVATLVVIMAMLQCVHGQSRVVICDDKRSPPCCTASGPNVFCSIIDRANGATYQYAFNSDTRCASHYAITELWQSGRARGDICATGVSKSSTSQVWQAALWIDDPYYVYSFHHSYNATIYLHWLFSYFIAFNCVSKPNVLQILVSSQKIKEEEEKEKISIDY